MLVTPAIRRERWGTRGCLGLAEQLILTKLVVKVREPISNQRMEGN